MIVIFSSMAGDVRLEVLLFKVRKDFEEQISRIITRIDSTEDEMKNHQDERESKHQPSVSIVIDALGLTTVCQTLGSVTICSILSLKQMLTHSRNGIP